MSKRDKEREKLEFTIYNNLEIFAQIECSKCFNKTSLYNITDGCDAVDELIEFGWTKRGDNVICPICSAKNKKK